MKNREKFWRDIEADEKMIKKVDKMIEKRERKEFEKWEKRASKEPYFWRNHKKIRAKENWL